MAITVVGVSTDTAGGGGLSPGNQLSFGVPFGAIPGDLLICYLAFGTTADSGSWSSTGWTGHTGALMNKSSANSNRQQITGLNKIMASGESSYTFTHSGTASSLVGHTGVMVALRGTNGLALDDPNDLNQTWAEIGGSASSSLAWRNQTIDNVGSIVICWAFTPLGASHTWNTGTTAWTEIADINTGSTNSNAHSSATAAYFIATGSGAHSLSSVSESASSHTSYMGGFGLVLRARQPAVLSVAFDSRLSGHIVADPILRDIRVTGRASSAVDHDSRIIGRASLATDRDAKITGQASSSTQYDVKVVPAGIMSLDRDARTKGQADAPFPVDVRIRGRADSARLQDARIQGQTTSFITWDIRVAGRIIETTPQDVRITGRSDSNTTRDLRITGRATSFTSYDIRLTGRDFSSVTRDVRITGRDFSNVTRDVRLTGRDSAFIVRDIRITGHQFSSRAQDARIAGKDTSLYVIDTRITAQASHSQAWDARATGTATNSIVRDVRLAGQAFLSAAYDVRVAGVFRLDEYDAEVYTIGDPGSISRRQSIIDQAVTVGDNEYVLVFPSGKVANAGNTLIGRLGWEGAIELQSITDTQGNTWTIDVSGTNGSISGAVVSSALTAPLKVGDTITFTWSSAVTEALMSADEWQGLLEGGFDQGEFSMGQNHQVATATTDPLSQPNELVIGAFVFDTDTYEPTFTPGSGFTELSEVTNGPGSPPSMLMAGEYKAVSSTAGVNATGEI